MSFFAELKRRNVFKVGLAYVIVAWIIIQVADTLLPTYGAPAWVMPVFTTIILLGFPLALVLSWALEISPSGISVTHDGDTTKGSPSGLILNFVIMGVMAVVILWLVFDRGQSPATIEVISTPEESTAIVEQPSRLPNSIAVLPFENLSPDPDNAYFAAGIHDTVLHELAKISDMNVIARTSVMPYADTTLSISEIAETLNVESIMEGTVQYAEGQVRITAQLINPETGAHIWSGNFDRPFADVFTIQSEISQRIADAIGAELLPQELQQITRQSFVSEEAYALYLQAKALVPNIAPNIPIEARNALHRAIELDPDFAEAYAFLAFQYALSLGTEDPLLTMTQRETFAREFAETAIRLNPDLGLAYSALAVLEGAYLREDAQQDYWEEALVRSPNDVDVLDDAIRFFASTGQMDRARELSGQVQNINPSALGTINIWLAYGSGDFSGFLEYMDNTDLSQLEPFAQTFFKLIQALFEIDGGNLEKASIILDEVESLGIPFTDFAFFYLPLANGLTGRQDLAARQMEEVIDYYGGSLPIKSESILILLGIGEEERALEMLNQLVDVEGSKGIETNIYGLIKNFWKLPVLEQPEFIEARRLFGIPIE